MSGWVKEVSPEELKDGELYFLALRHTDTHNNAHYRFSGRGLNGKTIWTVKPGIAIRYPCNERLRDLLKGNQNLAAVAIPANADTRWKARKKLYNRKEKK